jgi:DNA-binding NtrC family response regulator
MHRILIVEDNPVDQRLLEQALSDPTHEIEICSDGREALAAFERCAADVVISDVVMPNMEGNELLTELHRRIPGLPIILVTRFGSISAAVAMQAGAFDYVTKPVEVFELQTRVKRALELDQLHHENDTLRQELAGCFGPDSVVAESIASRRLMETGAAHPGQPLNGTDRGRERHGQGAGRTAGALLERPGQPSFCRRQLQGFCRERARKRAVRP